MTELIRFVEKEFRQFGVNKKREVVRLLYEISKRDNVSYKRVLSGLSGKNRSYSAVKEELLNLRFPQSAALNERLNPYLPKLEIDKKSTVKIRRHFELYPKNIYTEEKIKDNYLTRRLKGLFPKAAFKRISSLKDFIKKAQPFTIRDYNKRYENLFIIKERYDFFKKCPCTKSAISCGYHIFNLGFGCVFECTYCYMQEYTNCPGIILPANIEDFFEDFKRYARPGMRIGTGEFTDSLAIDGITQYSIPLVGFFNKNPEVIFEFKTKSDNIDNLLKAKHRGNIVVSWSLNPQVIIKENEFYSAPLKKRLDAALRCVRAGYRAGFHFDPIIYYKGWAGDYQDVVDRLFDIIPYSKIAWVSLGTLRFNPRLKVVIENRFPKNRILDEELLIGFDNKLRYYEKLRFFIYKNMLYWLRKRARDLHIYLCMEDKLMCRALGQF